MSNVPRRVAAQMSATAAFRLLMLLSGVLIVAGAMMHMPARLIVEAAPCAIAMLMLQTGRGDGCRFAAGIGVVWVLTMAGVLLIVALPQLPQAFAPLARLVPLCALGPWVPVGVAVVAAGLCAVGGRAPTDHRTSVRLLFLLLGAVVQVLVLQLTLGPIF